MLYGESGCWVLSFWGSRQAMSLLNVLHRRPDNVQGIQCTHTDYCLCSVPDVPRDKLHPVRQQHQHETS